MMIILKPLIEVDLPEDFVDIIKAKLKGQTVKSGEIITVDILGKPIEFKVLYAEPSPVKVTQKTQIKFAKGNVFEVSLDFKAKDCIITDAFIVLTGESEVLILNHNFEEIRRIEFENLKKIVVKGDLVVLIGEEKVKILKLQ
ncbi:atpase [Pyrococcus furiosus COM1]|nr:atpase [Pyrococcus furiosus COM1]